MEAALLVQDLEPLISNRNLQMKRHDTGLSSLLDYASRK
jgi:hypothetical protein